MREKGDIVGIAMKSRKPSPVRPRSLPIAAIALFLSARGLPGQSPVPPDGTNPRPRTASESFGPRQIDAIRALAPAFPSRAAGDAMTGYLDFYGLDFPAAEHRWGFVDSAGGRIFVQGFEPEESAGTLLFIHGYMDHSGCQAPVVEDALSRGWAVYLMDLPGHGLSDGKRCDIGRFEDYGEAARAFLEAVQAESRDACRLVAAGHSTGCAAWLLCLLNRENPFESLVFGGPLVRSASWEWSKAGLFLGSAFMRELPRGPHMGPELIPYPFGTDPLGAESFPVHWVEELFSWNERNAAYGTLALPLTVLQGDKDTVVDWRFNLPFLEARITGLRVVSVKGGTHHVFRYADTLREPLEAVWDECMGRRKR